MKNEIEKCCGLLSMYEDTSENTNCQYNMHFNKNFPEWKMFSLCGNPNLSGLVKYPPPKKKTQ